MSRLAKVEFSELDKLFDSKFTNFGDRFAYIYATYSDKWRGYSIMVADEDATDGYVQWDLTQEELLKKLKFEGSILYEIINDKLPELFI